MENPPDQIRQMQSAYYNLVGKSIDDRVQPAQGSGIDAK
jgi:hypothetical protein